MTPYVHVQNSPSDTWVINHNLDRLVNVDVLMDLGAGLTKVIPKSVIADAGLNQITIKWSSAQIGQAILI